jgi:hypothetical protein
LPLAGVTVSQLLSLAAVQAHPLVVVTVTEPVAPPAATDALVGDRVNVHELDAACVTLKVCVPTVIVPVRDDAVLAAAVYVIVPVPLPDPGTAVSQLLLLVGVQLQSDVVVTVNVPVAPAALTDAVAGDST